MESRWTQLVLGVWIALSPWILGFSSITVMKWSNSAVGLVLILINIWEIFGKEQHQTNDK